MKYYIIAIYFALCSLISCKDYSFEERFYNKSSQEWSHNLKTLSMDKKWSVYLYGPANYEPPPIGLALDLARYRSLSLDVMIPIILNKNSQEELDAVYYVLEDMKDIVDYDPCSYTPFRDTAVQTALIQKVPHGIKYKCNP